MRHVTQPNASTYTWQLATRALVTIHLQFASDVANSTVKSARRGSRFGRVVVHDGHTADDHGALVSGGSGGSCARRCRGGGLTSAPGGAPAPGGQLAGFSGG